MATYNHISDIKFIDKDSISRLEECGIRSITALLEKGRTFEGRHQLSIVLQKELETILFWINCADLFRVKGVGKDYLELLVFCGISSIDLLCECEADDLITKIEIANHSLKSPVASLPAERQLDSWIDQANLMAKLITY